MKTEALDFPAARTRTWDFFALTKPRLNLLVVATAAAGYYMGAGDEVHYPTLVNTVVGTALVAGGAAGLNQVFERDLDARMNRTKLRPLPDGRLQPVEASRFSMALAIIGALQLAIGANLLAAAIAAATLLSYVGIYTPLKRLTSFSTIAGAVPGALPPLIGWAAARGAISIEALSLFGIIFFWQMPHFLAIAWMYRDDYERAGIPLLPVVEPDGASTGRQVAWHASALVPVSLIPAVAGLTTNLYFAGALALGLAFLAVSLRFAVRRRLSDARTLFIASIVYLPLLWALMVINRVH